MDECTRRFGPELEKGVVAAALDCPGECIFLEPDPEDLVGLDGW
jgi:hypothetical protein